MALLTQWSWVRTSPKSFRSIIDNYDERNGSSFVGVLKNLTPSDPVDLKSGGRFIGHRKLGLEF